MNIDAWRIQKLITNNSLSTPDDKTLPTNTARSVWRQINTYYSMTAGGKKVKVVKYEWLAHASYRHLKLKLHMVTSDIFTNLNSDLS